MDKLLNWVNNHNKMTKVLLIAIIVIVVAITSIVIITHRPVNSSDVREVQSLLDKAWDSNIYLQANISDDEYIAFLYNKKKEAFAQSQQGGVAVYRNDDKFVSFGDSIEIAYNMSPLRQIELALQMVRDKKAKIESIKGIDNSKDSLKTYKITIEGKEGIQQLYSMVNKGYANTFISQLYSSAKPNGSKMIITVAKGGNNTLGASCDIVLNGQTYTSWYFDGYLSMFDWALSKDWYDNDTSDTTKWEKLISSLVNEVEVKSKKYAVDNNIDLTKNSNKTTENSNSSNTSSTTASAAKDPGLIINGIALGNLQANNITYKEWILLTDTEKTSIVREVLDTVKNAGKTVSQKEDKFIQEVNNYYISNDKTKSVSDIVVSIGMKQKYIK